MSPNDKPEISDLVKSNSAAIQTLVLELSNSNRHPLGKYIPHVINFIVSFTIIATFLYGMFSKMIDVEVKIIKVEQRYVNEKIVEMKEENKEFKTMMRTWEKTLNNLVAKFEMSLDRLACNEN